jgi:P-type Cu+ transporter
MKKVEACYHCGEPCPQYPPRVEEKAFCCEGCRSVYMLLAEHNLCTYYNLQESHSKPVSNESGKAYTYLDTPEMLAQLGEYADNKQARIRFEIPSIHCSACIYLLEQLPRLVAGVRTAEVNFSRRTVLVTFAPEEVKLSTIVSMLHKLGYPPSLNLDKASKTGEYRTEDRRLIYRIGVTGFCFGNIMLLALPDYLAGWRVDEGMLLFFNYLNLALALPVFLFGAWPYLRSAWQGLRYRYFTIDQPLALGIAVMMLRSSYEVMSGTGTGFFDSMAGLVFFLLVGRYFQQRTYHFLSFERDYRSYFPLAVSVLSKNGQEEPTLLPKLKTGDRIVVRTGELIPADAVLASGAASIDYSFVTGESIPVAKQVGETIFAGGRQIGGRIELLVQRTVKQSALTDLWNHAAFRKPNLGGYIGLIQTLSRYFTIIVLTLAALTASYWLVVDPSKAMQSFTAVLIVACPCALALATPFAFGHLTRIMGRHGLYLKNADTVERLARVRKLVFDKTGTLSTSHQAQMAFFPSQNAHLTAQEAAPVYALAAQSAHPLCRSLCQFIQVPARSIEVNDVQEVVGQGVYATIAGYEVRLGNAQFVGKSTESEKQPEGSHMWLSMNSEVRGYFGLTQQMREGVPTMLGALTKHYPLVLLSGDSDAAHTAAEALAPWFQAQEMHFCCTPQEKLDKIEAMETAGERTAMIGDGLNDAGALQRAFVGIAVTEDTARFTPASDAILHTNGLKRLPDLLGLSRDALWIVKLCFAVSLTYNLTGTWFAVQGELSPMIAAILMPFSSIGIITVATAAAYIAAYRRGLFPFVPEVHEPMKPQVPQQKAYTPTQTPEPELLWT